MIKQVQTTNNFKATIKRVVERKGKYGPCLFWEFHDEKSNSYIGFTESLLKLGNRTWTWLHCLGYHLNENESFNFEDLQGQECYAYAGGKTGTISIVTKEGTQPSKSSQSLDTTSPDLPPQPEGSVKDEVDKLFS